MSAYGKVSYTESDEAVEETVVENIQENTAIESQVSKFDNSYTAEKLKELYSEYDKITLDEEKIKSMTEIKVNAVSQRVPFRTALVLTTSVIVTVLLAFLCIYNLFVINNMGNNISYLQEEVASYEYDYVQAEGLYNNLTSIDNIQYELTEMGYADITFAATTRLLSK